VKYLCLVYVADDRVAALPAWGSDIRAGADNDDRATWRGRGVYLAAHALYPEQTTTIRVRNGHLAISDGPRVATRDRLTEFYLIEASDLNDAIRVVAKLPQIGLGCVEIRAVGGCEPVEPYRGA